VQSWPAVLPNNQTKQASLANYESILRQQKKLSVSSSWTTRRSRDAPIL
jgi:hypothetical protein